jgi:hypothetical protein
MGTLSEGEAPCPLFMDYEDESYLKVHEMFQEMYEEKKLCAIFVATKTVIDPEYDDKIIFESPDNGKTVYVRKFGSVERTLLDEKESESLRLRGLWKL